MYTHDDLVKLVHDTKAVSIWNRKTGPVFWYAASVPGPFYVNTEQVIGATLADGLLKKITAIIASTPDLAARAAQLNTLILGAYTSDPTYKRLIDTLVATAKEKILAGTYSLVSGGERRDWLFSIPFAKECGLRHAFIFKNLSIYCEQALKPGESALHVADLINNAASYFDAWLPALTTANLKCPTTLCINTRGTNGVQRLESNGQKVITLNSIDVAFFEKSLANGLIDKDVLEEIKTYFGSSKEWASKYLMGDTALFDVKNLDGKSFERLQSFFKNDPWSLRGSNEAFFSAMQKVIDGKKAA